MVCPNCKPEAAAELTRLRAEVERLRSESERWKEIVADELKETLGLMDAAGVTQDVAAGQSCVDALTDRIKRLRRVEEAASWFVFHHTESKREMLNAGTLLLHANQAAHWLSQLSAALTPAKPASGDSDATNQ